MALADGSFKPEVQWVAGSTEKIPLPSALTGIPSRSTVFMILSVRIEFASDGDRVVAANVEVWGADSESRLGIEERLAGEISNMRSISNPQHSGNLRFVRTGKKHDRMMERPAASIIKDVFSSGFNMTEAVENKLFTQASICKNSAGIPQFGGLETTITIIVIFNSRSLRVLMSHCDTSDICLAISEVIPHSFEQPKI